MPFFDYQHKETEAARATMDRVGRELLDQSKAAGEKSGTARDLLSVLVRANTSEDVPAHQRMSDEDVLAREF
jgi:hypothetical protein